ncbi:MAG: hypothetical protein JWM89_2373, partial [Acidimicrobiales bacterium]|nr:hypothetical protein [Acidimicrobiales bacterium]
HHRHAKIRAVAVERDERTGRIVGGRVGPRPAAAPRPSSPDRAATSPLAAEDGPDRVAAVQLRRAWIPALVLGLAGFAIVAGVIASAGLADGWWFGLLLATLAWYWAGQIGCRVWSLGHGSGRWVFLVDHRTVDGTARHQYLSGVSLAGRWVHVVDAVDEEDLGWVEVGRRGARRLRDEPVVAMFGGGADGMRWIAFAGPFDPVRSMGDRVVELPADPGIFGELGARRAKAVRRERARARGRRYL